MKLNLQYSKHGNIFLCYQLLQKPTNISAHIITLHLDFFILQLHADLSCSAQARKILLLYLSYIGFWLKLNQNLAYKWSACISSASHMFRVPSRGMQVHLMLSASQTVIFASSWRLWHSHFSAPCLQGNVPCFTHSVELCFSSKKLKIAMKLWYQRMEGRVGWQEHPDGHWGFFCKDERRPMVEDVPVQLLWQHCWRRDTEWTRSVLQPPVHCWCWLCDGPTSCKAG